jgi:hypothetical protein
MGVNWVERLKTKLKTRYIIGESVKIFQAKIDSFKTLGSCEIAKIPDDDLSIAVMSWMQEIIGDDRNGRSDAFLDMSHPCQFVFACRTTVDELCNGGFNQLYFNDTAKLVKVAEEGFSSIGAKSLSVIMEEANAVFEKTWERLSAYDDGTVEGLVKSYDEHVFDELDRRFYDEIEACGFDELLNSYIRGNSCCFGHS